MVPLILPPWHPELGAAPPDGDLTWAYPWPAGERLAAYLAAGLGVEVDCRKLRVAELGCGRGRCGLTALALGAAAVRFCDVAVEPLAYVGRALLANGLEGGSTCQHAWGTPVPDGPYDLVLGADILYRPTFQRALLQSVVQSLAPAGRALLADPRSVLEPELKEIAVELGLHLRLERRPGPYTLVTATLVPESRLRTR